MNDRVLRIVRPKSVCASLLVDLTNVLGLRFLFAYERTPPVNVLAFSKATSETPTTAYRALRAVNLGMSHTSFRFGFETDDWRRKDGGEPGEGLGSAWVSVLPPVLPRG